MGMQPTRMLVLLGVLVLIGLQAARLSAQGGAAQLDLSNAVMVELEDAKGNVVLRGLFSVVRDADGKHQRHAALGPAFADLSAAGEAEIDISRAHDGTVQQKVDVAVRNLPPNARLTIVIDEREVGMLTTNRRGHGDFEVETTSGSGRTFKAS
jgi:hypothetical protein